VIRIRDVLTARGRAFLAAGTTLLVGGLLLGFADISRFGALLVVLPLLAATATLRRKSRLIVSRTVYPARLVVGQNATVDVVFENASGRRTQLRLAEERVDHVLGDRPRFLLPPMEPGEIRSAEYQICSAARGRHRLGPLMLHVRDPFGLATTATSLPTTTDVLVLPSFEILGKGRPRGEGMGAEGAVPRMVALHGEDDVAIRSYRDGDDLRRIHWPATAHRSELMVRQEDRPARRRAVIVLDSRADGHQGSGDEGSFEWAVTAAASIAVHLSRHGYALHLVTGETTADSDAAQTVDLDRALASLAVAQLGSGRQFEDVLHWAHPMTSAGGLVTAIVTAHDEAALHRIAALRQPGGTGLLFLLDSSTYAREQPGPPTKEALAMAGLVAAAGWSTCVVGSGMTVTQAWETVSAHSAFMIGAQ
jgi:uncharacterized protein (DUF58 family)